MGPRSLGTHRPQLPLVTEVLASARPTATWLAVHISPSGCPPCVSQSASSRSFTWQLTAPLFKKKRKRRKKIFFFFPYKRHKAWEREEGLMQRRQLWALACPPLRLPGHQAFTLGHQWGLRDCPPERHCVKGMLGLALVCHLCPHSREDLGPERVKDLPRVTAEQTQHGNIQDVRGVGGIMLG